MAAAAFVASFSAVFEESRMLNLAPGTLHRVFASRDATCALRSLCVVAHGKAHVTWARYVTFAPDSNSKNGNESGFVSSRSLFSRGPGAKR